MPPFLALLLKILPYLPSIVRAVESIHPLPNSGAQKLQTAISLVQTVAPAIIEHVEKDTENRGKLTGLIGAVVTGINAAKSWTPPDNSSPFPQ